MAQMQSHVPTEPQGGKVYCETFETEDGDQKNTYASSKEDSRLVYVSEVAHDSGKGTTLTMCFRKIVRPLVINNDLLSISVQSCRYSTS